MGEFDNEPGLPGNPKPFGAGASTPKVEIEDTLPDYKKSPFAGILVLCASVLVAGGFYSVWPLVPPPVKVPAVVVDKVPTKSPVEIREVIAPAELAALDSAIFGLMERVKNLESHNVLLQAQLKKYHKTPRMVPHGQIPAGYVKVQHWRRKKKL